MHFEEMTVTMIWIEIGMPMPKDFCSIGVVARVESLRGRMSPSGIISEAGRQVEGLFESLLSGSFA
jgi:hypothetical protein